MATQSIGFPTYSGQVSGFSGSRSVRLPGKQSASPVLQPVPPRVSLGWGGGGGGGERPILHMGEVTTFTPSHHQH